MDIDYHFCACYVVRGIGFVGVRHRGFFFHVMTLRLRDGCPFGQFLGGTLGHVTYGVFNGRLFNGLLERYTASANAFLRRSAAFRGNSKRDFCIGAQVLDGTSVFNNGRDVGSVKEWVDVTAMGAVVLIW